MTDRPIIMSAGSVLAILAGRKTMTTTITAPGVTVITTAAQLPRTFYEPLPRETLQQAYDRVALLHGKPPVVYSLAGIYRFGYPEEGA